MSKEIEKSKWLAFMQAKGMNEEKGQKRQEEIQSFMELPLLHREELQPGDIIITKQYKPKHQLDPVAQSLRYFYKHMTSFASASRFSQHLYLVVDTNHFAHLLDPYSEVVPAYEPPTQLQNIHADCTGVVYRFNNIAIAKRAVAIAKELASKPFEERQKTFTGFCPKNHPIYEKLHIPPEIPVLKTAAHIMQQTLFPDANTAKDSEEKSWCSRWVIEIYQQAIRDVLTISESENYEPLLKVNGKVMHTKLCESTLNKLTENGLSTIAGKTYTFGIPIGLINRKQPSLTAREIYDQFVEEDKNKVRAML